jgi:hypothetical protein
MGPAGKIYTFKKMRGRKGGRREEKETAKERGRRGRLPLHLGSVGVTGFTPGPPWRNSGSLSKTERLQHNNITKGTP